MKISNYNWSISRIGDYSAKDQQQDEDNGDTEAQSIQCSFSGRALDIVNTIRGRRSKFVIRRWRCP